MCRKRLCLLILAVVFLLTLLPVSAMAEEIAGGTSGMGLVWELDEDGTLTISGYGGLYKDTSLSEYKDRIVSVVFNGVPDSISIDDDVFAGFEKLTTVDFGDSVGYIGPNAFAHCVNLRSITIPGGVLTIDDGAFSGCIGLQEVNLSEGLSQIGGFAFEGCVNIKEISVPESVWHIGERAFKGCVRLEKVVIGSDPIINDAAFENCGKLRDVYFLGHRPSMDQVFTWLTLTAHYPAYINTWDSYDFADYGGDVTWVPFYYNGSRIYGDNRWATSLQIADEMKKNLDIEKFDAVIIASGNDFADALAGSYLSTVKNAPILLSWGKGGNYEYLDADNVRYIKENLAENGTVYILGGTNAVPDSYETNLEGWNIRRLGGTNRFETNLLILREAGVRPGEEILVCTSTNFADSLSASATGLPILLVWNEGGKLFDSQKEYLAGLPGNNYCIIGGENAVSNTLMTTLGNYGSTSRLAGKDRFATSVLVAQKYFDSNDAVVLAYAWNYPDGLCGGALAYSMGSPLILAMNCYETAAAEYADARNLHKCAILGGTGLISDEAVNAVFGGAVCGHQYTEEVIAPTVDKKGYTQHTCSRCGHSYRDNYTEKLTADSWKAAYRAFIIEQAESGIPTDIASYYLVYLDNDKIPELWINYGYTFAGCQLAYYYNGKVISTYLSAGNLDYHEFDNVFKHSYGRQGIYGDTIYSLKDGKLVVLADGNYEARVDQYGRPNFDVYDYYWDGKAVSESGYYSRIAKYIDVSSCSSTSGYYDSAYDYDEILYALRDSSWGCAYAGKINELINSNLMSAEYNEYACAYLTYLDGDDIPELWFYPDFGWPVYLMTYKDGKVYCHEFNNMEAMSFGYIEKKNIIHFSTGHQSMDWDMIFTLRNGQVEVLAEGTIERIWNDYGYTGNYRCVWQGKEVSLDTYRGYLENYIDPRSVIYASDCEQYTYNDIMNILYS